MSKLGSKSAAGGRGIGGEKARPKKGEASMSDDRTVSDVFGLGNLRDRMRLIRELSDESGA